MGLYILESFAWIWDSLSTKHDEDTLDVCASPGLMTILDVSLYKRFEGELSPTVIAAHNLLEAFIALQHQSMHQIHSIVKQQQQQCQTELKDNQNGFLALEDSVGLCRSLLDSAYEAVGAITTDPFAQSANCPDSGSNETVHQDSLSETGRRHRRNVRPSASHYWESERLYCPDAIWADTMAQHCQRLIRHLLKLWKDYQSSSRTDLAYTEERMKVLYGIIADDIPVRLAQFRAAMDANAVVLQRLYLVKCEYRNPFRAFLEAHQSLQRAPSVELVREYMSLPKSKVEYRRDECKTRLQKLLHTPTLVEALTLTQKIEEFEGLMAKSLFGLSELARFLDHRKGWIRADATSHDNYYRLQDTLRRLRTVLCRKAGQASSTGIRPILLDLQGIPRDDVLPSPWPTISDFLHDISSLSSLCGRPRSFRAEKRPELDIPTSIVQGCRGWDAELFRCQYADWLMMVERQYALTDNSDFLALSEKIRRAEMQVSLAMSTEQSLSVVLQRLDVISSDKDKLWRALQDILEDVAMRELHPMRLNVSQPPKQMELTYQAPAVPELGIFDTALTGADIPLQP